MRIVVPITAQNLDEARIQMDLAERLKVDLIEIRHDYFITPCLGDIPVLLKHNATEKIYTLRSPAQVDKSLPSRGFQGTYEAGLELMQLAKNEDVDFIDQEFGIEFPKRGAGSKTRFIRSYHDFNSTPGSVLELHSLHKNIRDGSMQEKDIVKIATTARSYRDSWTMLEFLRQTKIAGFQVVGLCMGPYGIPSRVYGPACGSCWTYACLSGFSESARGQMTVGKLREAGELLGLE